MAGKTREIDIAAATWSELLDQLSDLRLDRDWSYRQLAEDIQRVTDFEISHATLQPLLSVPAAERAKPYDRTIHKIRQYLEKVLAGESKPQRRATA